MKRLLSVSELASRLGVTTVTVNNWLRKGLIEGVACGHGDKAKIGFTVFEAMIVAIARDLHQQGLSLSTTTNITNWLRGQTLEGLERQWSEGQTLLFAVGDQKPFPCLLSFEQVYRNKAIDLPAANAAGVSVVVIDTKEAHRQLTQHVSALRETRKAGRNVKDTKSSQAR